MLTQIHNRAGSIDGLHSGPLHTSGYNVAADLWQTY